jgi:hypothetical protein
MILAGIEFAVGGMIAIGALWVLGWIVFIAIAMVEGMVEGRKKTQ